MQEVMNWHVVYTKPGNERKVAQRLTQRGIETYCPRYSVTQRAAEQVDVLSKLLFSRWVFLYCTPSQLPALKKLDGVINVLYWQNRPAIVSHEEISTIRYALDQYREIAVQKMSLVEEYSIGTPQEGSAAFSLPSIGYTLLAQGKVEHTVVSLPNQLTVRTVETTKLYRLPGSVQALLKRLPSVFTGRTVKHPVLLSRKLEQQ